MLHNMYLNVCAINVNISSLYFYQTEYMGVSLRDCSEKRAPSV